MRIITPEGNLFGSARCAGDGRRPSIPALFGIRGSSPLQNKPA